jgi:serine/threonine protein kinase
MSTCSKCGTKYPDTVRFCTQDGTVLEADAPAESNQIGKVLAGKYRLDAYLSRGGMGSVYRATHLMLEKPVALKVIKPELVGSSEFARRFQREARAATSLNHPNIVAVYDLGQAEDGTLYIAMELVDGPSLKDAIQKGGPMDPIRIVRLVRQVLGALALAHRHHIVHRDLKPQNIMLASDRDGNEIAKLVDFGIAKTFDDRTQLTSTGFAIGTPQYMAPEQASGSDVDGRSDLYSLGIILYEMLVAEVPFNDPSTPAILVKHLTEAPVRPSLRRTDIEVHRGLEDIAVRCLEKDPAKRYQSAEEMAQAMAAAVSLDGSAASVSEAATLPMGAPHLTMGSTHTAARAVPTPPANVPAPSSAPAAAAAAATPVPVPSPAAAPAAAPKPPTPAVPMPLAVGAQQPAPVVKSGRNSLALGVGALAIVALAGMGFALTKFVGGSTPASQSALTPAPSTPASSEPQSPSATAAATPGSPPAGSGETPSTESKPTDSKPAEPAASAGPSSATPPPAVATSQARRDAARIAPEAARGTVPPPSAAGSARGTAPPPAPPSAPAPPPAPTLAENPTVLLRCDGAAEVCTAVRDAFGPALQREKMTVTTSAPRADVYIVVSASALDGSVQQQFGTTFVVRNYSIAVELEAPRFDAAPAAPEGRTFSADLRVGKERVNENARLVANDTVEKIREFWTRRRLQGN